MNRWSQRGLKLFRLALGVGIFLYLLSRVPRGSLGATLRVSLHEPLWLAAGLACTFLGLLSGVVRWRRILEVQGLVLPGSRVFRIFFMGQFFNAFMPGACGGDIARAYYAAKDAPRGRTEAVSTVFVDRAVGLFALMLVSCGIIAVRLPFFLHHSQTKLTGLVMLAFLAASVVAILALFRRNLFEHLRIFRRLESETHVGPLIRRAYEAFYLYRHHRDVMLRAFWLSVLNLVFLTLACACFAYSLRIPLPHPVINHFTLFPIITTLAAIPLTPGALGLREGLFAGLYAALGVATVHAISLSLLVYAGGLAWSLLGGIFFIAHSAEEHRGLRKELAAMQDGPPVRPSSTRTGGD